MTIQREDNPDQRQEVTDSCWKSTGVMGDGTCPQLAAAVHCRNCKVFADAGQQLFERQPPADYILAQTLLLAEEAERPDAASEAMIVFRMGEEWLALDVAAVVEVTELRTVHRVPHRADRLLVGIVNIRGELQLCVSLRKLLGLAEAEAVPENGSDSAAGTRRFLVCEHQDQRWAFVVDEVSGVRRIGVDQLSNVPSTIARSGKRLINAVFTWDDHSVGRLDKDRLFRSLEGGTA